MRRFGRNFYVPWRTHKRFTGNWDHRLAGVFDCGVDFSGKTILDAGCNVGIVDYEIAKRSPAFIHGMDEYRAAIRMARHIFLGIDTESRFDVADLTNDRRLHELLRPSYDIVIMMAVWHQIRTASGEAVADRVVATLARRCSGTFITKNNPEFARHFTAVMMKQGFRVAYDSDPLGRLYTYVRS